MKKADGWSMGQEEQKKKALEEKLRRRAYTAAFEAAQQRKEKPWQSWDEAFSERLAKQPFITEEERKPFTPSGAGAQNAFYTGEKQPWPGLGEAWPGQARRAERTPWAALPENLPDGAGTMLLAGQRRSMAQAAPGGEPPAGPEQGAPGFALEGVDPAYRDAVYAGQALAELLRPERRKAGTETGKALQPGGGYGTLKKRQDTESWRDAFLEQQAALQAQTLAQERAQAEGVGAAYTKYVRPLLERAALGLSTALSPIPSVPGSEPGTGLAQAIETSNANYERNKTHDISGRPVHGQGVDAAGEFAYGNSQMKDSGCGVIGTYNALYLLGKDPSLAEVGRRYEISGAMAGGEILIGKHMLLRALMLDAVAGARRAEPGGSGHVKAVHTQIEQRGGAQLFLFFRRNGFARHPVAQIGAQLDLDKQERPLLLGDEVDLAEAAAPLFFHDAAAARFEVFRDQRLAPVTVLLGAHRRASHFLRNVLRCTGLGPYRSSIS